MKTLYIPGQLETLRVQMEVLRLARDNGHCFTAEENAEIARLCQVAEYHYKRASEPQPVPQEHKPMATRVVRKPPLFRILAALGLLALLIFLLSGCSTVRPLAEYQHLSHATQHFGSKQTNLGYDVASVGVRWRPTQKITVDLLEGVALQEMHGRSEVFTGRVTVEF